MPSDPARLRLGRDRRPKCPRAEAEFDEVKAEHRDHLRMCDGRLDRLKQANAAQARVRALCDEAAVWTEQGYGWTTVDEIRDAIEGDT